MLSEGILYKTKKFGCRTYIGDPVNIVRIFNEFEADEFIIVDYEAAKKNSLPNYKLVEKLSYASKAPICFGGGLDSFDKAKNLISLGIEKVLIGAAAFTKPGLIEEVSSFYGSQSVSVCLDVRSDQSTKKPGIYIQNGSECVSNQLTKEIFRLTQLGAGELVVNDISRDGLRNGFNKDLFKNAVDVSPVPVTALGGAKGLEDISDLFRYCDSQKNMGIAAGSLWTFYSENREVLPFYPERGVLMNLFNR